VSPPAGVFVDRWNVKKLMIDTRPDSRAADFRSHFCDQRLSESARFFAVLERGVRVFLLPALIVALRTLVPAENLLAANAMSVPGVPMPRCAFCPRRRPALWSLADGKACFYVDTASFLFSGAAMLSTLLIARRRRARTGEICCAH